MQICISATDRIGRVAPTQQARQLIGVKMPRWPHLASCPDNFEEFADVLFVVGGQRMPAHSQYLAATSKLMQTLMSDAHSFSKEQPLVLDQQLRAFSEADLQTFLNHVYLNSEVESAAAADALLRVADLFDASKLMEKAVSHLDENSGDSMFATPDDVLRWLMLAERFKLPSFLKKCANHAAIRYKDVCTHPRFDQLEGPALKAILKGVHSLTELHPGLTQQQADADRGIMYKLLKAGQMHRSEGVTVSATHVKQSYRCKTSRQVRRDNGTFPVLCQGHHGSWSWNLQRHVWQLDGKPAVITKVLPGNVLELADLIGSPACCTGDESEYSQQGW